MTASRGRRLRQWARQLPGAARSRRWVARRLRSSDTARSLVKRLYALDAGSPVPLDVAPGRVVGGVGTESLPVTLIVILGADTDTIGGTVDEIARLQLMSAGFRPVIVTDRPAFAAIRRYGYPAELLLPRDEWDVDLQGVGWEEYAQRRLALLFSTYRASASVNLGPAGLDDTARLLLGSLRAATA